MVNECLYDEKPALRTGQGTALGHALVGSLEKPAFAIYRSLICVLDRTALPVRNRFQHRTDPFPSIEQRLPSCCLKAVSLFGFNMKEGKH